MIPGAFDYHAPASLQEALSLLSANVDDAKVLAGGQSLLPLMKLRLAKPEVIIDIGGLAELNYIREDGDHIAIGALATYTDVAESELIRSRCPLLAQTAVVVGDVQVRNRGTVGGGLAHADPAEDLPAAILALDAELKAAGPGGERRIPADEFFITMLTTTLMPEELLTEIRVPCPGRLQVRLPEGIPAGRRLRHRRRRRVPQGVRRRRLRGHRHRRHGGG